MERDYAAAGEDLHGEVARNYDCHLEMWARAEQGRVPEGYVPWTTFWLQREDGTLLGGVRLRHRLNRKLREDGGHIGYDIRPSRRGKGYATKMLAMALDEARTRGLTWVLITVAGSNRASIRVVEKNGGRFMGLAPKSGLRRYRILLDRDQKSFA